MQYSVILDKCFDLTLKTYSLFFVSKIGKAYFRKARHTCGINKKRTYFCKFRAIGRRNPPKQQPDLKFLEYENYKTKSKRALRTGTSNIKCIKLAQIGENRYSSKNIKYFARINF